MLFHRGCPSPILQRTLIAHAVGEVPLDELLHRRRRQGQTGQTTPQTRYTRVRGAVTEHGALGTVAADREHTGERDPGALAVFVTERPQQLHRRVGPTRSAATISPSIASALARVPVTAGRR